MDVGITRDGGVVVVSDGLVLGGVAVVVVVGGTVEEVEGVERSVVVLAVLVVVGLWMVVDVDVIDEGVVVVVSDGASVVGGIRVVVGQC